MRRGFDDLEPVAPMIESTDIIAEYTLALVRMFGLPVLLLLFTLKGLLIGKLVPTSIVLPGYVISVGASYRFALLVLGLITAAYLLGQYLLYLGTGRYGFTVLSVVPGIELDADSERLQRSVSWFNQYGWVAVVLTTVVPWTRGVIAVPARISAYPFRRYAVSASAATVLSHSIYIFVPMAGLSVLS